MEARDFRYLTEAYYQVYENQELDEAPFQIYGPPLNGPSDASSVRIGKPYQEGKNPRAARKRAKTRAEKLNQEIGGHRYTVHKVDEAKEEVDLYDIILSHLLDEGYAETPEAAEQMMVNMSEGWRDSILEKFISPYEGKPSYNNPQGHSPATKAMQKSDKLQATEPGSERQKKQTRRSQQLNRMFQAARRA